MTEIRRELHISTEEHFVSVASAPAQCDGTSHMQAVIMPNHS